MMELQSLGQYRIETLIDSFWAAPGLRVTRCRVVDTVRKRPALLSLLENQPASGLDARGVLRLLEQAMPAADLVHPRLAWVWEASEIDGQYYIAERAVQGQTLAQRLAAGGPLSWPESKKAVEQIAQGLDYAHTHGWTHGALSPEMIWLSPELGAITSGWGLQRSLQALRLDSPSGESQDLRMQYLAPERLAGAAPSPAADQYSLACLWFEMLTAQPLFPAPPPEALETLAAQRQAGPIFPPTWPEGTPLEIETALERATAIVPTSRYDSASHLAGAPEQLAAQMPLSAEERSRRAALALERQENAEQARRQAEEASRLAALSQARKEIEEQVQRASQASLRLDADETAEAAPGPTAAQVPADQAAANAQPEAALSPAPVSTAPLSPATRAETSLSSSRGVTRKAGAAGAVGARAAQATGSTAAESSNVAIYPLPDKPASQAQAGAAAIPAPPVGPVEAVETSQPRSQAPVKTPRWILWAGLAVAALLFGWLWWSSQGGGGFSATATPTPETRLPSATALATQALAPAGQVSPTPVPPSATTVPATAMLTATATRVVSATMTRTPAASATPTLTNTPTVTATRPRIPSSTPRANDTERRTRDDN